MLEEERRQRKVYWEAKCKLYWKKDNNLPAGWRLRINRKSVVARQFREVQKQVVSKVFKENIQRNKRKVKQLKEVKTQEESNAEEEDIR